MVGALVPGSKLQGLDRCRTRKAVELFYLHTLSMIRRSFHTRRFWSIHRSAFRYRFTKNGFTGPKSLRGFRETCPCSGNCVLGQHTLFSKCLSSSRCRGICELLGRPKNFRGSDLRWASIPSRGSRNTPSRFTLQKPG